MVSKMEKKLRRKLDITKVRKQQKSVKLLNALVWLGPSKITRFTCMPQCGSIGNLPNLKKKKIVKMIYSITL